MTQQVLCDSEQVTLNVGGSRFTTTISTLRNAPSPSLFAAMFSGRHELQRCADGSVFIDRDGRHFADGRDKDGTLHMLMGYQVAAFPLNSCGVECCLGPTISCFFVGLSP